MRILRFAPILVCILAVLVACAFTPTPPPVSPLPEIRNSPLMGQWRAETVTMDGVTTDLRGYSPTFITFTQDGQVETVEYCNHGWRSIYYREPGRFRLGSGMSTAAACSTVYNLDWSIAGCSNYAPAGASEEECGEAGLRLVNLPNSALDKSNQYVLSGDQLLLLGDGVWMQLARDNSIMPWFMIGHWAVNKVTRDGKATDYTEAGPILVTFQPDGFAWVYDRCQIASFAYSLSHDLALDVGFPYPSVYPCDHGVSLFNPPSKCIGLVGMEGSFGDCLTLYEGLIKDLLGAIDAVDHVESSSDGHLYLRGDGVEIDLASPPDFVDYWGMGNLAPR